MKTSTLAAIAAATFAVATSATLPVFASDWTDARVQLHRSRRTARPGRRRRKDDYGDWGGDGEHLVGERSAPEGRHIRPYDMRWLRCGRCVRHARGGCAELGGRASFGQLRRQSRPRRQAQGNDDYRQVAAPQGTAGEFLGQIIQILWGQTPKNPEYRRLASLDDTPVCATTSSTHIGSSACFSR